MTGQSWSCSHSIPWCRCSCTHTNLQRCCVKDGKKLQRHSPSAHADADAIRGLWVDARRLVWRRDRLADAVFRIADREHAADRLSAVRVFSAVEVIVVIIVIPMMVVEVTVVDYRRRTDGTFWDLDIGTLWTFWGVDVWAARHGLARRTGDVPVLGTLWALGTLFVVVRWARSRGRAGRDLRTVAVWAGQNLRALEIRTVAVWAIGTAPVGVLRARRFLAQRSGRQQRERRDDQDHRRCFHYPR